MDIRNLSDDELDNLINQAQGSKPSNDLSSLSDDDLDRLINQAQGSKPAVNTPATKPAVNQAAPKQPTTNINNPTPQPTKTLTGGVSVNVTNPNKSQSTWRNAGRQFARGTARALAPEKLENWAVGSKNDEALLNQYIQSGVPTYEQIDKDYRAGKIDKAKLKVLVNKRKNFDDLMADAEYRAVRNKNIGKGTLEVGTAAIGGGAGTAAAKVGAQAIKQGSKQLAKQALKEVGKTSAIGAGYGASEGVIDENINPVTNALKQAAIWGTTHAATLGAGKGIQAAANTKAGKAVGKAVSDAKAKVDDKVFDAITSTEAGIKALQAVENAKNAIGKELTKERTFKQHKQSKATKPQEVIENMPEASGKPVEVETGINTPETNLTHVKKAPVSSKTIDNIETPQNTPIIQGRDNSTSKEVRERAGVDKFRELGIDVSDLPEDVKQYERKTYRDTKQQLDALTPEQKATLINDPDAASDIANLAKIEEITESLDRGEVPIKSIGNYIKSGTTQGQALQSRSYLTNTPAGSFIEIEKGLMQAHPEATKLKEETAQLIEAFNNRDAATVNEIIRRAGLSNKRKNKNFINALDDLASKEQLNEQNVIDLIDKKYGVSKVTTEDYNNLKKMYEVLQDITPGTDEYRVQAALINKYIYDKLPVSKGQQFSAFRNINFLGNPVTATRNVTSTGGFGLVEQLLTTPLATLYDKNLARKTKFRSITMPNLKAYGRGLVRGFKQGARDVRLGIDTRIDKNTAGRFDITPETFKWHSFKDFKNNLKNADDKIDAIKSTIGFIRDNALHYPEKVLNYVLKVPDRAFFEAAYEQSIANQLAAKGIKEPTEKEIITATEEALEQVFQNNGTFARTVSNLRKTMNNANLNDFGVKFGAGDAAIPYAQTPANVKQQQINYSPLGFIRAHLKYKKGGSQREYATNLARATVGTTAGTTALAGATAGAYKLHKDKKKYDKKYKNDVLMGKIPNSIELPNGKVFSIDNTEPVKGFVRNAMAFSDAAEIAKNEKGLKKLRAVYPILDLATEPVSEIISDATKFGEALENGSEATLDYAGGKIINAATSGLAKRIAKSTDKFERETKGNSEIETAFNEWKSSVPGLRQTLSVKKDLAGQEIKTRGPVQELLNPYNIKDISNDVTLNKINKARELTGRSEFDLPIPSNKIKIKQNGVEKEVQLTPEQYAEYKTYLGQISISIRNNIRKEGKLDNLDKKNKESIDKTAKRLSDADSLTRQYIYYKLFNGDEPKTGRLTTRGVQKMSKQKAADFNKIKRLYKKIERNELNNK